MCKLKTKTGRLTSYGFACGYVERSGPFTLSMEHGVYHIKGYSYTGARIWETARTLTQARKALRTIRNTQGLPSNDHGTTAAITRFQRNPF